MQFYHHIAGMDTNQLHYVLVVIFVYWGFLRLDRELSTHLAHHSNSLAVHLMALVLQIYNMKSILDDLFLGILGFDCTYLYSIHRLSTLLLYKDNEVIHLAIGWTVFLRISAINRNK